MARIIRSIEASIGITFCFFYLGCGSVQVASALGGSNSGPLTVATKLLPSAIAGTPYVVVLDAAGGTPGYTWGIATGKLPSGISLSPNTGTISGTPTVTGTFPIGVTLSDASNPIQTGTSNQTITVAPVPLAIVASAQPSATVGAAYALTLQATGGTPSYTWSITSGTLPAGLRLGNSTGMISGTPTAIGAANFGVTVRDHERPVQTQSITMSISVASNSLQILTLTLPSAASGASYSQVLRASGGTPGYKWTIASGNLPAGLALAQSTGAITGVPTVSGSATFTASLTDSSKPIQTVLAPLTIVVAPTSLAISPSALPSVAVGSAYSQVLHATGGTAPYIWSVTSGSLPAGLALSPSTGGISGTPSTSGTSTFIATVTDSSHTAQSASATMAVVVTPSHLAIAPSALPSVRVGTAYSQVLRASGGTTPYVWSIASGRLPAGLNLKQSTGMISGTPTLSGTATFTATVIDSGVPSQSATSTSAVVVTSNPLVITSSALPAMTAGAAYSQTLQASGGTAPYTWSITSGRLPTGLNLAPSTGTISGTPATNGPFTFTTTVTDASTPAQTASAATTVVVVTTSTSLTILTSSLPPISAGVGYSQSLQATGGIAPYIWRIASGQLPVGLSLSSSGVISGTATSSGSSSFSVTVSDSSVPAETYTSSMTIVGAGIPLTITSSSLYAGTNGTGYSQVLQASGGTPAYTWSITSGSLPAGLTLAATTGVISGTPTSNGVSNFTATVSDNGNPVQTQFAATTISVSSTPVATGPGTTWYVNAGGGTRYSVNIPTGLCDGTNSSAPVGTTPNQHCAFNDIRYLWTDGSYTTDTGAGAPSWGWIGSGGDTYLIDCSGMTGGACRIGQSGPNSGDSFGLHGNPYGAGAPPPLSGTPGGHTHIFGINHAACSAQGARTQIFGGYATGSVLSMAGASYVDVACLDISDHSNCGKQGQVVGCKTDFPVGDFADSGVVWSNTSTNDTLTDVRIHGMARAGLFGPTGTGVVMTNIALIGNASSGWNADPGNGTTGTGTLLVQNFNISWNGCAEEYPIVDALPYNDCTDDGGGGYGDGFGTTTVPSSPGWQAHFDQGVVSYNTQDGLDALHLTGAGSSMAITRVLAYGNMGQQIKVGGASGTATNNVIVGNCNAMRQTIPGTPAGYNAHLGDFCRAADTAILMTVGKGSTLTFDNNTLYAANATAVEIECDATAGACDSTSLIDFRNNIFLGFLNNSADGYPGSTTGDYSNPIYLGVNPFTNAGSIFANNVTYHAKSNWTCPATGLNETNAICADPQLVDETWHLYGYGNMAPTASGSVKVGAGTGVSGVAIDLQRRIQPSHLNAGGLGSISAGVLVAIVGLGIWHIHGRYR